MPSLLLRLPHLHPLLDRQALAERREVVPCVQSEPVQYRAVGYGVEDYVVVGSVVVSWVGKGGEGRERGRT